MEHPADIVFQNLDPSDSVRELIGHKVEKLERLYPRILSCRIVVDLPHRHHQHGGVFQVRIELKVPGAELVFGQHGNEDETHSEVHAAVRHAFEGIQRQLQDHLCLIRGEVKHHFEPVEDHPKTELARISHQISS